ncbi:TrbG/VirB9 family P-type conjugative transfer protein [Asticcacaulis sp.]|uniref:TrbG/VirB9 family P-type conjugative transfer protein n=1 Tax=Asticcacaulis sp. TaxID=1872648 RepID=UPI002634F532|nr:TrbG/VirB9 family P-type conjugative transfer protein [Asticcacaulis sp.]
MTKRLLPLPLLAVLLTPTPCFADNRILWKDYDEAAIVTVPGRAGIQTTIQFEAGERIENVAIGDSAGWQVTPNRRADLLFLKPILPDSRTNMTVITDRRTYLFDLTTAGKGGPLYVMRFVYPKAFIPPAPVAADSLPPDITTDPAAAVTAEIQAALPADLNFAWEKQGPEKMLPAQVFDDGRSTYLRWEAGAEVPAILVPGPDGVDGPANYALRNDLVVLDGVPRRIILRNGSRTASLTPATQTAERTR